MPSTDSSSAASEEIKKLIATADLPELGPGPRASVLPLAILEQKLDETLGRSGLAVAAHQPIRAAVLLWHDHLDASHRISQDLPGPDGSYLHGLMHRREPDYSNAKYWFHRVGRHVCFPELARRTAALLESKRESALESRLIPRGDWEPFAFVDACEECAGRSGSASQARLLQEIQAIEFELLLHKFSHSKPGDFRAQ